MFCQYIINYSIYKKRSKNDKVQQPDRVDGIDKEYQGITNPLLAKNEVFGIKITDASTMLDNFDKN